jgi:hypothetical protein
VIQPELRQASRHNRMDNKTDMPTKTVDTKKRHVRRYAAYIKGFSRPALAVQRKIRIVAKSEVVNNCLE